MTTPITATFVRRERYHFTNAGIYRLSRTVDSPSGAFMFRHVAASAVDVPFSGPETYLFAVHEDGTVISWMELPGSFRGGLDEERALRNAGWVVAS